MSTEGTGEGQQPSGAPEGDKPVLSDIQPAGLPNENGRPDHVPEKFWDAEKRTVNTEALLKSYTELEKSRQAPEGEPAAEPKPAAETPSSSADGKVTPKEAPKADPNAELIELARNEWAEKQELGEETYGKLAQAGFPKAMVDYYLAGVRAETEKLLSTLHGYTGGQETFNAMTAWAGTVMSKEEAEAYNSALDNPALRENAVRGLFARYQEANQQAPKPSEGALVPPSGGFNGAGDTYQSRDELIKDQKDPRYQSDPAFRRSVAEKLERSRKANTMGPVVETSRFPRAIYSN